MSDGQELPVELKPTFKKVLLAPTTVTLSLRTLTSCFVRAPAVIIQETCSYLQESLGTPVISESVLGLLCLACATSSPSSDTLARFDCGLRMASTIVTLAPNFDDLRQAILEYLTKNDTSALLHQFATQEPPRIDFSCGQGLSNICPSTYDETRIRLHQRLTVMILSIGLHSSPCDAGLGAVLAILLDKQTKLSSLKFLCTACPSYKSQLQTSALSLFEAGSTPQMQGVSQNWRENLARELSRDVNRQHESVTRLIGEICRDLELRCSEAERPFREEQSRSRDLQAKLEDSQIRVDELEVQAQSQRSELDDLRNDKNSLKEQADSCEERLKDLGKKLEQMHQDFDQSKRHHERATQAALESSRQRDLDCMAIVAGKDLVLDEQAIKLAASEGRIYELEDELAQQQSRALQDAETIKGDKARIQELHTDVASAKELAALKQVEIDRLTASEARLIETKEQLAKEAQDNAHRHEILISDQHNQLKAEKDRSAELRQRHEDFAGTKDAEIQRLEDSHRSSDERLQAALEEARTSAAIADQENILQITDLKKGIKQLRKEREERAQEVSEAKALKHGFMAFMGNINDQPGLAGKQSRTSIPDIGTGSPEQPAPGSNLVSSFGTGTSSRSGPTPKRTKRHRVSSHVPTSKAAQPDGDTRSVRHRVLGPPRSPLKELGTARSSGQLTPTQRIRWDKPARNENAEPRAMQENLEAQGWNSDDESFGGGDIFTSTDQRQLSALRSRTPLKSPRAGFDETTTEF